MKFWQKTYLCTLVLFLAALDIGAFFAGRAAYGAALDAERERAASEHGFIRDALYRELLYIDPDRGGLAQELFLGYADYYAQQGARLGLFLDDGRAYSALPEADWPVAPAGGAQLVAWRESDEGPFLAVAGRLAEDSPYVLVSAHDTTALRARSQRLTRGLVLISAGMSAVLSAALYLVLNKLNEPIRALSLTAAAFADGDMTARARAEGRDEIAELAATFNAMAARLESQLLRLSEEAEARQRFIDDLAHELRTPITAIGGYAEYLLGAAATEEERYEALDYVRRESARLSELSEKLLLLTRLRTQKPDRAPVQLSPLMRDAAAALKVQAADKNLRISLSGDACWQSDAALLYVLLCNLMVNALRASATGAELRVRASADALVVEDDGQGMDAETLRHITEPFYRGDKARSREDGGAGLGLSIAQRVAGALGLRLRFQSAPGQGTRAEILRVDDNMEKTS